MSAGHEASSLLSILLVASSPKTGPQLLFSYPPHPSPLARLARPIYDSPLSAFARNKARNRKPAANAASRRSSLATSADSSDSEDSLPEGTDRKQGQQPESISDGSEDEENDEGDEMIDARAVSGYDLDGREEESPAPGLAMLPARNFAPLSAGYALPSLTQHSPAGAVLASPLPGGASHSIAYSHYLGIDVGILATFLIPSSKELCDTKFESILDYLAFVSHPVWLDGKRQRMRKRHAEKASRQNSTLSESATSRRESTTQRSASGASPPPASSNGYTSSAKEDAKETDPKEEERAASALETFNLVLVIDTPPDKHLSNHLDVYYQ